ncbi:hypothetical protein PFISCL1PPCAC_8085, partial [Pristionchus fissidentatus]
SFIQMSRKERTTRRGGGSSQETTSCYCDGVRQVGTLELLCSGCAKWFHSSCLKDLSDFNGLAFMICYTFNCKNCSPTKSESWTPKQANFIHMCVTVLANLTKEHWEKQGISLNETLPEHCFFNLESHIIPYVKDNWSWLTSMPPRVKTTWHGTLQKTLVKEADLFKVDPNDENSFALLELDLSSISPSHEAVKQIGRKVSTGNNLTTTLVDQSKIEKLATADDGPKTRGATKRKVVEPVASSTVPKKAKTTADYSSARIGGSSFDIPFNKDGYRYYIIESDKNCYDKNAIEEEDTTTARTIPGHLYRVVSQPTVTISPNDRAYQLRLSDDHLSITGHEGYSVARATHSVAAGKWYFEVQFTKAPPDSAVRIGWAQQYAVVQATVGYNKFSYGWRSHKGTKFHNGIGKTYYKKGFTEGDVLGCLISLPLDVAHPGPDSSKYIPDSGKDHTLIKFKNNYFYEEREEPSNILKTLEPLEGSYIEFFHNGTSCGRAFTDLNRGFYFPAVSLFRQASLRLNFGPSFVHRPPKGVRAMSERTEELAVHQSMADMIYLVDKNLYRENP